MRSILLLCFVMFSLCLYAQDEQYNETDSIETSFLSEVTVSANRWEQNIADVPNKVTTIKQSLISFENPQTAADLLGISNNVFVQKSQLGGGSPMIRGFATNRVLLVVDGVRMNNAIFRSGNVQNVISLDANTIEEAEVLFGPGAVMYGSDAIGGVMDFHTINPIYSIQEKPLVTTDAMLRYSSANNERTGHARIGVGFNKVAFLSSVTRSLYDDLRMGSNGPEEYTRPDYVVREDGNDVVKINSDKNIQRFTGYDQWNFMQKVQYKPTESLETSYAYHYSKTSDYPRYDRLILRDDNGQLDNGAWYYGPQRWEMHQLQFNYSYPLSFADQMKLNIAYQDFQESRHNRGFGSSTRTNRFENVKAFSVNLDVDKKLNEATTLYYGGEYITNNVYSTANRLNISSGALSDVSTRYPNDSDWRSGAVYMSLRYKPNTLWTTNVSARLTHISAYAAFDKSMFDFPFDYAEIDKTAVNASLGLVYHPSYAVKWYANLSTGFRAPNIDDLGKVFDSEPGNVVVPNPELNPEYAYSAETGFATIIRGALKFDMSVYYTLLDNAIARAPSTFNGNDSIMYDGERSRVLALQNISEIWVAGMQAGFEIDITPSIGLRTTASFQEGEERDAELSQYYRPTHVPPFFGSTHLTYKTKRLKVDIYSNYNGKVAYSNLPLSERGDAHLYAADKNGDPYAPSWLTVNIKSSFRFNRHLTLDAGIENLTDKRYRPYSSGISAAGRNFIFAIRAAL
ncbi:MAG TPA: TonB-dependent receptor [Chryseosolibacter sp.]|nr:TonB-dependent receptor [Chryseosolibacter sp.]